MTHNTGSLSLRGKIVVVTGGGTGVGRSVCLQAAAAGAEGVAVVFHSSVTAASEVVNEVEALGSIGVAYQCDTSNDQQVRTMMANIVDRFGHIDVLVNNAASTHFVPAHDLEALTDEVWDDVLSVNLMGAFYCSRAAGQALKESAGMIINVSSTSGLRASGSSIPYCVSKAGLLQLTRNLAVAMAPEVRVNSIVPGYIATDWRARHGHSAPELEQAVAASTPLGRVATAEDIAQAIVSLMLTGYITGSEIVVDGGKSIC